MGAWQGSGKGAAQRDPRSLTDWVGGDNQTREVKKTALR